MISTGRTLRPLASMSGPDKKFAWSLRIARVTHFDSKMRDTAYFANRLGLETNNALKAGTINKLERGLIPFSVDHCLSFESVLGLDRGQLVDLYCYTHRMHNSSPKGSFWKFEKANGHHLELISRMSSGDRLDPLEWLELAGLASSVPELFHGRVLRQNLADAYFAALQDSYERDERLLLESAISFGDLLLPSVAERIEAEPERMFNLIETLGHMPSRIAASSLRLAWPLSQDDFVVPNVLEAINRVIRTAPWLAEDMEARGFMADVRDRAYNLLLDENVSYMAKEEALDLLEGKELSPRQLQKLSAAENSINEVAIKSPESMVGALRAAISGAVAGARDLTSDARRELPLDGMVDLIQLALTKGSRRQRLAIGVLLSQGRCAEIAATAAGDVALNAVPATSVGIRRAAIRFLTKLGSDASRTPLIELSYQEDPWDEGVKFVLAWSLGAYPDAEAKRQLLRLYSSDSLSSTKRALLVAARRQGNLDLLQIMSRDPESRVATAAALATRGAGTATVERN